MRKGLSLIVGATAIYFGYQFLQPDLQIEFRKPTTMQGRSAVILGASGATGKYLTYHLLKNPQWSRITSIGRREMDLDALSTHVEGDISSDERAKLSQISLQNLFETDASLFKNHDVVFCAVGTTRGQAGSAEKFREIDHELVVRLAEISKEGSVPHFSLVSAQGANENIWYHESIHPLLYTYLKGKTNNDVAKLNLPRTSFFCPGMLHRPGTSRGMESMMMKVLPNTHVSDLAKAMIQDAQTSPPTSTEPPLTLQTKHIHELAKQYGR